MSGDIWDTLGIAPTLDEMVIRRAYATRLKRVRPDDDPDGFLKLRGAYEAAMKPAHGQAARNAQTLQYPSPAANPEPASAPSPELRAATLIQAGDTDAAASLLLAVRDDNAIALGPWMRLTDMLAWRLAQDPAIPDQQVKRIASDFGWYGAGSQPATQIVNALRARIDAAEWIAGVKADAARWTRFIGNDKAAASAMLLGRGKLGLAGLLPPYSELKPLLSGAQGHGPWATRGLDPDRLARLRDLLLETESQLRRRLTAKIASALAFAVAGDVRAAFLCAIVMISMKAALLRKFMIFASPFVLATALAAASGDERAVQGVFYCNAALFAGFFMTSCVIFTTSIATFIKTTGRDRLRQLALPLLITATIMVAYFFVAYSVDQDLAPMLRGFGLGDLMPLLGIAAPIIVAFIIKRAIGDDSDSLPRW